MKVDLYTKVVLTVIAICLIAIVLKPLYMAKPVQAGPEVIKVDIRKIGGNSIPNHTNYGIIPAYITNDKLNVQIKN